MAVTVHDVEYIGQLSFAKRLSLLHRSLSTGHKPAEKYLIACLRTLDVTMTHQYQRAGDKQIPSEVQNLHYYPA
jgi:hypothetical protein